MFPLLALAPLLMGGARYIQQADAEDAAEKIKAWRGSAPGLMYPGGQGDDAQQGPPQQTPGSGLMADPSDPNRQLEFMNNLMSLRPSQRNAAVNAFGPIMARAQAQAQAGAELGQRRAEVEQRGAQFQQEQAGIGERFRSEQDRLAKEFDQKVKQFGQGYALDWMRAQTERLNVLSSIEQRRLATQQALGLVPSIQGDYLQIPTAGGAPRRVPLQGTKPWNEERGHQDNLTQLYGDLNELTQSVQSNGPRSSGPTGARQAFAYNRLLEGLNALGGSSRYSKDKMDELKKAVTEPGDWHAGKYRRTDSMLAGYGALREFLQNEFTKSQNITQDWPGFNPAPLEQQPSLKATRGARQVRAAPPPPRGTVLLPD